MSDSNENGRWPLPEGWVRVAFDDAVEVISVSGKKVQKGEYQTIGALPIIDQGQDYIGGYTDDERLALDAKPPLVVFGDHTRTLKYVGFRFAAGADGIKVFKPKSQFDPRFLYYALTCIDLPNRGYSRHFQYLRKNFLPLPPLPEQHRIVAEIEKQFTRLDAAVAALRRAKANLARYKAAVLKAAVEGRLVAQADRPQRSSETSEVSEVSESASALLARTLAERRARWAAANPKKKYVEPKGPDVAGLPGLPVGWVWASIGQVVECLDHMRVPVNKIDRQKRTGDIPYYGANGRVGWIDNHIFDEPLVLVVEDETFLGRQTPFSYQISGKSWVNNHAHVLRPKATTASFLNYSLQFYPFTPLTTGTTGRRKLTQKALLEAPLALPPLVEQERIAEEIDRLTSVAQSSMHAIDVTLARADRLRQGVLGRAFRGESVANGETSEVF